MSLVSNSNNVESGTRDQAVAKKSSLFSLLTSARDWISKIIDRGGELDSSDEEVLVVNETTVRLKIDSYASLLFSLDAEEEQLVTLEKELKDRKKILNNVRDRLKNNLKAAMLLFEKDELVGSYYDFRLKKSNPRLVITDESKIPNEFKKTTVVTEIDKDSLKERLKFIDMPIEGATLEESYALTMKLRPKGLENDR